MRVHVTLFLLIIASHHYKGGNSSDSNIAEKDSKQLWTETTLDKLKKDLFRNYYKQTKPEESYNITYVKLGLVINHIDVNQLENTVTVHSWLTLAWTDSKLKWNTSDYGGLSVARIANHDIWKPDIYLFNSFYGGQSVEWFGDANAILYSNGEITWVPSVKLVTLCEFDLFYWPFDTQHCFLKFGSWTYKGDDIILELNNNQSSVDLDGFVLHTWMVTNTSAEILIKTYGSGIFYGPYCYAQFYFSLVRQSQPYKAIIVTPAIVMVILILIQFWLAPLSTERMFLNCFTSIVIFMFLLYFTSQILPTTSITPLIVIFYSANLLMVFISMIANVLVFPLSKIKQLQSLQDRIKEIQRGKFGKFFLLNCHYEECTTVEGKDNKIDQNLGSKIQHSHSSGISSLKYNQVGIIIALVVDRMLFITYSIIYIVLASLYLL